MVGSILLVGDGGPAGPVGAVVCCPWLYCSEMPTPTSGPSVADPSLRRGMVGVVIELEAGLEQTGRLGGPLVPEGADPGQRVVEALQQLVVGLDGLVEQLPAPLRTGVAPAQLGAQ